MIIKILIESQGEKWFGEELKINAVSDKWAEASSWKQLRSIFQKTMREVGRVWYFESRNKKLSLTEETGSDWKLNEIMPLQE